MVVDQVGQKFPSAGNYCRHSTVKQLKTSRNKVQYPLKCRTVLQGWGSLFSIRSQGCQKISTVFYERPEPRVGLHMQAQFSMDESNQASSMKGEPEKSQARGPFRSQCQDMTSAEGEHQPEIVSEW